MQRPRGGSRPSPRLAAVMILASVLLLGAVSAEPKVDPATGKIRMLLIGETYTQLPAIGYMLSDPMLEVTLIPAGSVVDEKTSKRFVRIYMPRSKAELLRNYDVVELFDFVPYALSDKHIQWIHDAVYKEGVGLALVEMGWYAVPDWTGNDAAAWMATVLYKAYPADLVIGKQNRRTAYMKILVREPSLVDLPGFDKTPLTEVQHHGIQVARPGSVVFTKWRAGNEDAIVGGRYGAGTTLMIPMGWDNVPLWTQEGWHYFISFVSNHAYYVAKVPLPKDPNLVQALRTAFSEYLTRKSLATSFLDFISGFGAKTDKIEQLLTEMEADRKKAQRLYIQGNYEASWQMMTSLLERFRRITDESMKLRKKALMWIYTIEWFVVTGTLFLAGIVIWNLMVKRRLYREVATTRGA